METTTNNDSTKIKSSSIYNPEGVLNNSEDVPESSRSALHTEEHNCMLNAFNNAAGAKHLLLSGAPQWKVLNKLNGCLSWVYPLLGVEHPMFNVEDPASQLILLNHKDVKRKGQEI